MGISALLIANLGIAALVMNGAFLTGKFTPFSLGEAIVAAIKEDTDKLAELKRRYDLLQDTFPLWPTQHFVRHIATLGIPAVITFIGGIPAIYRSVAPFVIQLFAHK